MYPIVIPLDQYCRQADYLGAAPLHLAAEQGCPPVVQYLLEVTVMIIGKFMVGSLMNIGEILIGWLYNNRTWAGFNHQQ